jgi:hypothetical protein
MRPCVPAAILASIALASCAGPQGARAAMARLLAEAPTSAPVRLHLLDDRIVAAAVPVGAGEVPPAARTSFEAIAPGGRIEVVAREWGERGDGYRLVKVYDDASRRSVLAARDGEVLERWHSVPMRPGEVPAVVLTAIAAVNANVLEARIVSGREREEYWEFSVQDRLGRAYVVRLGLDGSRRTTVRRLDAQIDA